MSIKNYYEVLGVSKEATKDEIKKAYRDKSIECHPDIEGGDALAFVELVAAYEALMDDEKRAEYDRTGFVDDEEEDRTTICHTTIRSLMNNIVNSAAALTEDVLVSMRKNISNDIRSCKQAVLTAKAKINTIEKMRKRLGVKDESKYNVLGSVLDESEDEANFTIIQRNYQMEIDKEILSILDNYTYSRS